MEPSYAILSTVGESLSTVLFLTGLLTAIDMFRNLGAAIIRRMMPRRIGEEIVDLWHSSVSAVYVLFAIALTLVIAVGTEPESKAAFYTSMHIAAALAIISLPTDTDD